MIARLNFFVWKIPGVRRVAKALYVPLRMEISRWRCYGYDLANDRRYSSWSRPSKSYGKLSNELIFQFHKLEKGLSLPAGARLFFGADACNAVLILLERWTKAGHARTAPIYQAALETLLAYDQRLATLVDTHEAACRLRTAIAPYLAEIIQPGRYTTPIPLPSTPQNAFDILHDLAHARRSVRNFSDRLVSRADVDRAVAIAQLSPSACNRQPWKLHFFTGAEKLHTLLSLQNGNAGFGHTIPLLAAVTVDMEAGFDASERVGPVLDGGLFLMSFLLALQAQGIASCCLNWAVVPDKDRKGHDLAHVPKNERILTLLAIGYPLEGCMVPLSPRRPHEETAIWH